MGVEHSTEYHKQQSETDLSESLEGTESLVDCLNVERSIDSASVLPGQSLPVEEVTPVMDDEEQQPFGGGVNQPELHPPQRKFDIGRWQETGGYSPVTGGAGQEEPNAQGDYRESQGEWYDLRDRFFEYLEGVDYDVTVFFELRLKRAGLLAGLEESAILPTATNPNPYQPEVEEDQHEQWWAANPEEEETFTRTLEEREAILKYLYLGALLGRCFPELFPQQES